MGKAQDKVGKKRKKKKKIGKRRVLEWREG